MGSAAPVLREGDGVQIRGVALLPGEKITHVFSPELGLTAEPPASGQVLIATNQRVLAFWRNDGRNETVLVPVEELKSVTVKSRTRSSASVAKGILLLIGSIILYLAVAYWLTSRFDGPTVPLVKMDVAPFLVLVIAIVVVAVIGRTYFVKEDGAVTFQGTNWSFDFPYRGVRAGQEIREVVNTLFVSRLPNNGHPYLWED